MPFFTWIISIYGSSSRDYLGRLQDGVCRAHLKRYRNGYGKNPHIGSTFPFTCQRPGTVLACLPVSDANSRLSTCETFKRCLCCSDDKHSHTTDRTMAAHVSHMRTPQGPVTMLQSDGLTKSFTTGSAYVGLRSFRHLHGPASPARDKTCAVSSCDLSTDCFMSMSCSERDMLKRTVLAVTPDMWLSQSVYIHLNYYPVNIIK